MNAQRLDALLGVEVALSDTDKHRCEYDRADSGNIDSVCGHRLDAHADG
jgi:hypothetical protein